MSSSNIVKQIISKDHDTISRLYLDVRMPFVKFIKKYAGIDTNEALELYQEAFYIMYCKLKDGGLPLLIPDLTKYIYGIGKNLIQNDYKRQQNTTREAFNEIDTAVNPFEEFSAALENNTKQEIVRKAVQALTDPCKSILYMFYWEKLHYDEMLGVIPHFTSINSLKSQKNKCMHYLSEAIIRSFKIASLD